MTSKNQKVDEYIAQFPPEIQVILRKLRSEISTSVKGATETISYGIPTFDLNEKHLVHFAAFKKHVSFFPTPSAIIAFKDDLTEYKTSKGAIQFPLDKAIPYKLIKQLVKFRVNEISS